MNQRSELDKLVKNLGAKVAGDKEAAQGQVFISNKRKKKTGQVIGRKDIVEAIYFRLDKSIKSKYITQSVNVICEELSIYLKENNSITVKNFGTLNPYLFHSHKGYNVHTGFVQEYPEFWSVKFHTHDSFRKLMEEKREYFSIKDKDLS